jgi:dienelactone hydrolase
MLSRIAIGALVVSLSGSGALAQIPAFGEDSVPLTWSKARVYIPGHTPMGANNAPVYRSMDNPETTALLTKITPKATIIYLHGCNGFHSGNETDGRWLSRSGFLVIMPDSFARPGRPSHCAAGLLPAGTRRDAFTPASVERRIQEVRYALAQAESMAAVDKKRLILWGHSEGGKTAVWYPGDEFRAHVATGDDCSNVAVPGMNTLKGKPVLVILFNLDTSIMMSRGRVQSCTRWSEGRNLKEVRYEGKAHWPGNYAEVRAEMLSFLCAQVGRIDDVKCKLDASTTPSRPADATGSRPEDQG